MILDLSQFTEQQIMLAVCNHALDLIDQANLRKFQEDYKRELEGLSATKDQQVDKDDDLGFMTRSIASGSMTLFTSWDGVATKPQPIDRTGLKIKVVAAIRNRDNIIFKSFNINGYDLVLNLNLTNLTRVNTNDFDSVYGQGAFEKAIEQLRAQVNQSSAQAVCEVSPSKFSIKPPMLVWARGLFIKATNANKVNNTEPGSPISPSSVSTHSATSPRPSPDPLT